jgi:hypothetical protein
MGCEPVARARRGFGGYPLVVVLARPQQGRDGLAVRSIFGEPS